MFSKETYIQRRAELKRLVGNGVIVLFGNNDSPMNYPANAYAPMRQDSTFLYYFGQHRDSLASSILTTMKNGSLVTTSMWRTSYGWAIPRQWLTSPQR